MSFKKDIVGLHENETLWGVLKANGFLTNLVITLSVCLALFHLVTSYTGQLEAFRHRTVHLMAVLIILFLASMEKRYKQELRPAKRNLFLVVDATFAILSVALQV